ncbi:MAG: ABC transporter permease [Theionarchaea archaeon]|nr:MAG: ABC transporter [Theionarchaea archaeon DG-70-1]MBU7025815.1 ABC transporter permease [Theionarchaea archaeon]
MMTMNNPVKDFKVIVEFLRLNRDLFFSWRAESTMQLLQVVINVTLVGIFAQLVSLDANIEQYGTATFLDFFLIGQIVNNLVYLPSGSISGILMGRNFAGLYIAPIPLWLIFLGMNSWMIMWRLMTNFLFIGIAVITFGMTFHLNFGVIVVFFFSILLMIALDLFAAGFIVATKSKQDPINWFLRISATLVSGTYFPPEELPVWIQPISKIHPQTYILKLARLTIGGGRTLTEVWPNLVNLVITSLIMLVIGYFMFQYGFRRARLAGTLGHM